MVHPDNVNQVTTSKDGESENLKPGVIHYYVGKEFSIELKFMLHDYMFKRVCAKSSKLGFRIVIEIYDFDSDRRETFSMMRCERSGKYKENVQKLKRDNIGTKKYLCAFKL